MHVLVTGGAGFIGSHTCVELIAGGHDVVVVDDLSAGYVEAVDRVGEITGTRPILEVGSITDTAFLESVLARHHVDAIIHFAARKAVGESTEIPLEYFHTNVTGTVTLLRAAHRAGVGRVVFSSSCSIYGDTRAVTLMKPRRPPPQTRMPGPSWPVSSSSNRPAITSTVCVPSACGISTPLVLIPAAGSVSSRGASPGMSCRT